MNRLSLVALLIVSTWTAPALAWVQSESSKGARLYWDDPCQTMYINEVGSDDIDDESEFDAIIASLEAWSEVQCTGFSVQFAGKTNNEVTGHLKENPSVNMVIFREKKWPYSTRPVAFTAVTYNVNTGEIFDADIELNGEDYAFTTTPNKEPWKMDVQNTVTHELGHVVGLDHTDLVQATMAEAAGPGETNKRTLEEDDIDGLCTLYPEDNGSCIEVEPKFLFCDFPEERTDDGCSASPVGSALAPALLLLLIAILARMRRRA